MSNSGGDIEVKIAVFGTTYAVNTSPENEARIRKAAALLESRVKEASELLKKTTVDRIPPQMFYAALGITDEMLMLREDSEQKLAGIEEVVDKSLISKFIKLKMAYGAERRDGN